MRSIITEPELQKARWSLQLQVAAALLNALVQSRQNFDYIDGQLKAKPGTALNWIIQLLTGKGGQMMNEISDFCLALDAEMEFTTTKDSQGAQNPATLADGGT